MRFVIQRVQKAEVIIQKQSHSSIEHGLLVLMGIHKEDDAKHLKWVANKLLHLRIFNDAEGKMNRDVKEVKGQILVVSQFTLYANCKNGRRPDFFQAASPEIAQPIYNQFIEILQQEDVAVKTGVFGADMQIALINDGPVTIVLEPS